MPDLPTPATLATWLTIKEASRAYGVSIFQIRHRLLEGEVPAGRLPTPTGWVWRIAPPGSAATGAPPSPPLASGDDPSTVAALLAEIGQLRAALAAYQTTSQNGEGAADGP